MYANVKAWQVGCCEIESGGQFVDEVDDRKKVFASLAECDIFGFHGGQGDGGLELTDPYDGAVT